MKLVAKIMTPRNTYVRTRDRANAMRRSCSNVKRVLDLNCMVTSGKVCAGSNIWVYTAKASSNTIFFSSDVTNALTSGEKPAAAMYVTVSLLVRRTHMIMSATVGSV